MDKLPVLKDNQANIVAQSLWHSLGSKTSWKPETSNENLPLSSTKIASPTCSILKWKGASPCILTNLFDPMIPAPFQYSRTNSPIEDSSLLPNAEAW